MAFRGCAGGGALCFPLVRRYRPLPAGLRYAVVVVAALPLIGSGTVHLFAPSAFLAAAAGLGPGAGTADETIMTVGQLF
jgi:hypothetical protein